MFTEVETISLDEFFRKVVGNSKIDVIKVDTEGAEGLMVDGSERILRNNNLKMVLEFWPEGLRKLGTDPLNLLLKMQEYGFKIKLINEGRQALEQIEPIEFCRVIDQKSGHQEFNLLFEK